MFTMFKAIYHGRSFGDQQLIDLLNIFVSGLTVSPDDPEKCLTSDINYDPRITEIDWRRIIRFLAVFDVNGFITNGHSEAHQLRENTPFSHKWTISLDISRNELTHKIESIFQSDDSNWNSPSGHYYQ